MSCENYSVLDEVKTQHETRPIFLNDVLRDESFDGAVPSYESIRASVVVNLGERFSGTDILAQLTAVTVVLIVAPYTKGRVIKTFHDDDHRHYMMVVFSKDSESGGEAYDTGGPFQSQVKINEEDGVYFVLLGEEEIKELG